MEIVTIEDGWRFNVEREEKGTILLIFESSMNKADFGFKVRNSDGEDKYYSYLSYERTDCPEVGFPSDSELEESRSKRSDVAEDIINSYGKLGYSAAIDQVSLFLNKKIKKLILVKKNYR